MKSEIKTLLHNLEIVVPADGLVKKIAKGVPLRIKLGFDPTAPDLHLGHAVVLKKLREFQLFGHKIVIIIGDFTACIGDPTGRNKTRPPLTQEEIKRNAATYLDQLEKMIDLKTTEIHWNSEWFDTLNLRETIRLVSKLTLSQIIQREDFATRYREHIPIHFHELLYPIMQGYDSLMIEADVEMGGVDQLFNCLVGRDIQRIYQKEEQVVACVPILRGTDGVKKMGKSLNNYIALTEGENDMYGKVMSIPDSLIEEYANLLSTFSSEKILEMGQWTNPMDFKKKLAHDIVMQFHGEEAANGGAECFYRQVQSRDDEVIEFDPTPFSKLELNFSQLNLLSLCFALFPQKSKGELRRLIEGGGVTLNGEKVVDPHEIIEQITKKNFKLKIGKRGFYEILLDD